MISDRPISATCVAAAALWMFGGTLVVLGLVAGIDFNGLGLLLAMGGGVLTIRWMLCQQCERERTAFDLGKDYGENVAEIRRR